MKGTVIVQSIAVWLAMLGICVPQVAFAATPPQPQAIDVSLHEGGSLLGQVVDAQGKPLADSQVVLQNTNRKLASAKTGGNGFFAFRGLRGGVYQVVAAKGHGTFRAWAPGTAPPAAQQGALIVAGQETVRGQCGPMGFWLCNPWVVAGIIAAAVAIPVAIHNADNDSTPSSP